MSVTKYKIGLVLSGGGARGFAHLGVMQALNEAGIYPDVISGTSAGALLICHLPVIYSNDNLMLMKNDGSCMKSSKRLP